MESFSGRLCGGQSGEYEDRGGQRPRVREWKEQRTFRTAAWGCGRGTKEPRVVFENKLYNRFRLRGKLRQWHRELFCPLSKLPPKPGTSVDTRSVAPAVAHSQFRSDRLSSRFCPGNMFRRSHCIRSSRRAPRLLAHGRFSHSICV